MTFETRQFSVIQGPQSGCLYLSIIGFLFFGVGGPILFVAQYLSGPLAFFGAFFVFAFLLNWFISRWLNAQIMVTSDDLGLTFEVTRSGLNIQPGTSFFAWDQMEGFKYRVENKGPNTLIIQWADGSKISFQEGDLDLLYQNLKDLYPEREID